MDIEEKTSPVYHVKAVPVEKVCANNYNPNVVAPPEMKLLVSRCLVYAIMTRKMTSILL